ncbi:MAG: M12 family metallo-peptidase [Acidobacteriota bacterium]
MTLRSLVPSSRSVFFLALAWFLLTALPLSAASSSVALASSDLAARALATPTGEELSITGVALDGRSTALALERFDVWSDDARIVVHGPDGDTVTAPPRDRAYLRGAVANAPRSRAMLSIAADGTVRGLIADSGSWWLVGAGDGAPSALRVDEDTLEAGRREFTCGADALRASPAGQRQEALLELEALLGSPALESIQGGQSYTARVAVETDNAFLSRFGGSTSGATDYVADLFAFVSTLYDSEVNTDVQVSDLSLWTSTDPWQQTNPTCGLFEFGEYWNQNNTDVDRTIAHFLSGNNSGGGVAWVGVLCNGAFTQNIGNSCPGMPASGQYGGDYGYSGGITGSFNPGNPTLVWDAVVVAHEIGHNFNSPHTHCYANLGGNSAPVDQCYNGQCGQTGCWCGAQSLPCTGQSGCGTLMSYCHLLGGGLSNMAPSFGTGHPWGVAPQRVPDRMAAHVASRAGSNPGCLDRIAINEIFTDGFESGNTSAWSE